VPSAGIVPRLFFVGRAVHTSMCSPRHRRIKGVTLMLPPFGLLSSLDDGGPEARLRSASRISVEAALRSVATSCRKLSSNTAQSTTLTLETYLLGAQSPSRLPASLLLQALKARLRHHQIEYDENANERRPPQSKPPTIIFLVLHRQLARRRGSRDR
jgi:hypothetical protein